MRVKFIKPAHGYSKGQEVDMQPSVARRCIAQGQCVAVKEPKRVKQEAPAAEAKQDEDPAPMASPTTRPIKSRLTRSTRRGSSEA